MKYILKILLAIILSAPIALIIQLPFMHIFTPEFFAEDNWANRGFYIAFPYYYMIIYFILGMPTTFVADFIATRKVFSNIDKAKYFIQIGTYTLAGLLMTGFHLDMNALIYIFIPVYTYLVILSILRMLFKKKNDFSIYTSKMS
ncbi:hypothetical protein ACSU64_27195 [Bacillaceae bacterium C204]|uniref:hypothetical protein n=1 Tax=Neobacillus sp. 204 TaxID=3383351 RepID=UPI00397BE601